MMAAIRHLKGLPVPPELHLPMRIIDRANVEGADVPYPERECPEWEAVATAAPPRDKGPA